MVGQGPYGAPPAPGVPGYTGDVYQQSGTKQVGPVVPKSTSPTIEGPCPVSWCVCSARRVMMEKAFYDGWADAAAAAARAAAAAGQDSENSTIS